MRLKHPICVVSVLLFVIPCCFALTDNQTALIENLANHTNISSVLLLDLFTYLESQNTTIVQNTTVNVTYAFNATDFYVNRTELVDLYYTANDTKAMIDAFEGTVDDRFMSMRDTYVRQDEINETLSGMENRLHNNTATINENIYNLAKNTDNRFNIAYFLLAIALIGAGYNAYTYRKKYVNISDDIKSVLPDISYEPKTLDETDSSRGFINRLKGISSIKNKIYSLKTPDTLKHKLIDKTNQGLISDEDDLKREIELLKAEVKVKKDEKHKPEALRRNGKKHR